MKVEIYGAEWCTFCKQAAKLCEAKSLEYTYIDIDDSSNLKALEERMGTKVKSVPQIFIDGEYIPNGFTGLRSRV